MRGSALAGALLATVLAAPDAEALTTVRFVLADPGVAVGATTTLEIRADMDAPVLGFGIDLVLDPAVLTATTSPVIGPSWTPVFAPDGDGLAGLAPISGVVGSDVLLATLTVARSSILQTTIDGSVTPGDLAEGFALLAGGFDAVTFTPTTLAAIPEPGTLVLVAGGLAATARWRRARRGA